MTACFPTSHGDPSSARSIANWSPNSAMNRLSDFSPIERIFSPHGLPHAGFMAPLIVVAWIVDGDSTFPTTAHCTTAESSSSSLKVATSPSASMRFKRPNRSATPGSDSGSFPVPPDELPDLHRLPTPCQLTTIGENKCHVKITDKCDPN